MLDTVNILCSVLSVWGHWPDKEHINCKKYSTACQCFLCKKGIINKQKYYYLIRVKTHTIHRSIDLEDTLTLQVTRPTKENNLACLLQSTLHLMQIEGIRYRYSLKILLLFADWMGVTHIHEEFVCDWHVWILFKTLFWNKRVNLS